jgi:GxxExxY protein
LNRKGRKERREKSRREKEKEKIKNKEKREGVKQIEMLGDDVSEENLLSKAILGAAIEVHKALGPGLLESVYEHCLAYEFTARGISFEQQKALPVVYKNVQLEMGYRLDFLVDGLVVVELKTVDEILPIHHAQLITYLKLTHCRLGLLLNFNVVRLKEGGIKRIALDL